MIRMLTRNPGWKLLALVLAFGFWYALGGRGEVAANVPVIVQYRNIPPDLEITSDHLDRLFVKLRGPASRLTPEELAKTAVTIDLAGVNNPGDQTFTIDSANLGLPGGVSLVRVVPAQIRVHFDRRGSKTVPVDVRYTGPPPGGYRISEQSVYPPSVQVVGPEAKLSHVDSIPTDAVDLDAAVGTREFRVSLSTGDPHVRLDPPIQYAVVRITTQKIP
jgi:YbbR domain-containing protein